MHTLCSTVISDTQMLNEMSNEIDDTDISRIL